MNPSYAFSFLLFSANSALSVVAAQILAFLFLPTFNFYLFNLFSANLHNLCASLPLSRLREGRVIFSLSELLN